MQGTQEYIATLWDRTAHLEELASRISALQKEQHTIGKTRAESLRQEIGEISAQITSCDASLHTLAKEVEHFVQGFQHVAFKESVHKIERQADMLAIDSWVTKKEFKKMLER